MALFNSEDYIKKVMESENIDDCPKVPIPEIEEKQNYIFISYSHRDYKQVFSDLALMYEKGVRFWYDYDLKAGKNWNKEAFKKIRDPRCSGVIFYLSENLFLSQSVIEEIRITLGLDDDNQQTDDPVNYFSVNLTENRPSDIIFKARASMTDEEWNARGYDGDWNLTLLTAFRDKATYVKFNTPDHNVQLITQIKKNFNVMDDSSSKQGKYEGEMLNGKRHGFGKAVYDNGTVYEGYWENDQKHGKGKYIYPESNKAEYFEGTFVNDVIHGYGVYQIKNGTRYEGNFTDGKTTGDFTVTHTNGEVYIGQLVSSVRHGKGKIIYSKEDTRDYYEGDWDNGNRHGEGTLVWKSGQKYTGQWGSNVLNGKGRMDFTEKTTWLYHEGEYKNDKRNGFGKMEYRSGDSWEGEFKDDNKYNGTGTVDYSDGKIYTGEFKDGKRNGFGKCVYSNGRIYEGQWKDNLWHGTGKVTYEIGNKWISYEGEVNEDKITGIGKITYAESSNMSTYEGGMLEALRHGEGTLIWKNGATFTGYWEKDKREGKGRLDYEETNDWLYHEGEYKNDLRDGFGKMEYRNGDSWEGTWKEGSRYTGVGTVTYTSGKKYTGEIKELKLEGQGILVYPNGETYTGEFKDNKYDGKGKLVYSKNANVVSYEGDFKQGKRHGYGKLIFANGDVYEGSWFDDCRHGYGVTTYAMNKGLYKAHKGRWSNSKMWFYGEYVMLDDSKRTGMFEDDMLNGPGLIINKHGKEKHVIWKNGAIDPKTNKFTDWLWNSMQGNYGYTGELKDGFPDGFGVYRYDDGSVYEGDFKEGNFEGAGRLVLKTGKEYIGDFKNGKLNGKCSINNGDWKYVGECVDDEMHGEGELHIKFYYYVGTFEHNQPKGEGYVTGISGNKYKFIDGVCQDEKAAEPIKNFFKTNITLR